MLSARVGPHNSLAGESATSADTDLGVLYNHVLSSPNDQAALEQLRSRASELLNYLRDGGTEESLLSGPPNVSAEWLAKVYEALSDSGTPAPAALQRSVRDELLAQYQNDEDEIGRAFNSMLEGLPEWLTNLVSFFRDVPRVSATEQRHLQETTSAAVAWPACAGLIACGITPLGVHYAAKSVMPLVDRLRRQNVLVASRAVTLCDQTVDRDFEDAPLVPVDPLVLELAQVAHCGRPAARRLLRWLIDVAQFRPYLFNRAEASIDGRCVRLVPTQHVMNLVERWGRSRPCDSERAPDPKPVPSEIGATTLTP